MQLPRSERQNIASRYEGVSDLASSALAAQRSLDEALESAGTRRLLQITSEAIIKLAFGTVRGDQCRKCHADYQRLRLITTYLGPGTKWLPEHAVRREALEYPPACPDEANQIIVRGPKLIQRAYPGDVLLLRGHDGVCGEALGAVHRLPPVAASGTTRVVFVASL